MMHKLWSLSTTQLSDFESSAAQKAGGVVMALLIRQIRKKQESSNSLATIMLRFSRKMIYLSQALKSRKHYSRRRIRSHLFRMKATALTNQRWRKTK